MSKESGDWIKICSTVALIKPHTVFALLSASVFAKATDILGTFVQLLTRHQELALDFYAAKGLY